MAAPTVEVTITLSSMDGVPYEGVEVTAKLDKNDIYQGFVISDAVSGTTDEDGVVVLNLFPNHPESGLGITGSLYTFRAYPPGGKPWKVTAQVPNENCNLEDIADLEEVGSLTQAQAAVTTAQASALSASASAATASGHATTASSAATAAATSAAAAATSATASASSATAAATSVTAAAASATAAAASAAAADASADAAAQSVQDAQEAAENASGAYYGAEPPADPFDGQEWVNSTNGRRYTRINDGTSTQWVECGPAAYIAYETQILTKTANWTTIVAEEQAIFVHESSHASAIVCTISNDHSPGNAAFTWIVEDGAGTVTIQAESDDLYVAGGEEETAVILTGPAMATAVMSSNGRWMITGQGLSV